MVDGVGVVDRVIYVSAKGIWGSSVGLYWFERRNDHDRMIIARYQAK